MTSFPTFPKPSWPFSVADTGQALAGLIARDSNGMPKPGMLAAPTVTVVSSSWKIRVTRFAYVSHTSGAIQISGLSAVEDVTLTTASGIPSGQSRIDRIVWNPATETLESVTGVPGTSPVAPSIGGRVPVARYVVQAGDSMVLAARLTTEFETTALAGSATVAYTPIVSGYATGFPPEMRAQYTRVGNVVEVELQAVTDREVSRITGPILVTTPMPIGNSPVAVEGGGYFLIGPTDGKRIYNGHVRQASATQVVVELSKLTGNIIERIPVTQAGLPALDWVSWRVRFSYTVA